MLNEVQRRFEIHITEISDEIDVATYSRNTVFFLFYNDFCFFFPSGKTLIIWPLCKLFFGCSLVQNIKLMRVSKMDNMNLLFELPSLDSIFFCHTVLWML